MIPEFRTGAQSPNLYAQAALKDNALFQGIPTQQSGSTFDKFSPINPQTTNDALGFTLSPPVQTNTGFDINGATLSSGNSYGYNPQGNANTTDLFKAQDTTTDVIGTDLTPKVDTDGFFGDMTGMDIANAGINTIGAVGELWAGIGQVNAMKDKVQISRDALNFDIAKDTRIQDAYKAARA
jgi:hypothetical protein